MIKKRFLSLLLLSFLAVIAFAQKEYYTNIDGVKGGADLKNALYNLIKNHKNISYGSGESKTWGAFYTTDAVVENGKRRVLDMYSAEKRYFGSKGSAVSGMNIEHSVANSWWGGTKNDAYNDLHHLNPSDATANSRKSNFPLGELTSVSWNNGVTFVGKANIDGSSQNAYEPCDEYKGDFARVFMYMFTCYQNLTWKYTWMNYANSTYPTLKPWAVKLLLKWHKQDPVSEKEVNRNNAVYAVQGNRNPFVDYPQLADYVWGDSINYVFHLTGEVEGGNGGNNGGNDNDDKPTVDVPQGYTLRMYEAFDSTDKYFTSVCTQGNFPWIFEYQCAEVTSSDDDDNSHDAESWLVSTSFDFSKDGAAKLLFDYVIRFTAADKVAQYNSLCISADYKGDVKSAEWETIDFGAVQNNTSWSHTTTDTIVLPAKYMGNSNVTLAFRYVGTATQAGVFEVDNVKLFTIEGDNDGESLGGGSTGGDDNAGGDDNSGGNDGNFASGSFTLVTDAAKLTVGDSIIIAYENFVMGAHSDNGNYRTKTSATINNGVITSYADDTQIVVLAQGAQAGTYALNVGNGYLAASSNGSNYVKTVSTVDDNASWAITIGSDALATVKAQGSYSRNVLQYNTGSPRFSCYSGNQKHVNIYAKSSVATGVVETVCDNTVVTVYSITGVCVRRAVGYEKAVAGLAKGIYIVNGKKLLVK